FLGHGRKFNKSSRTKWMQELQCLDVVADGYSCFQDLFVLKEADNFWSHPCHIQPDQNDLFRKRNLQDSHFVMMTPDKNRFRFGIKTHQLEPVNFFEDAAQSERVGNDQNSTRKSS